MALLASMLGEWQRWTCSHQWVRARWDDGSYGLRCAQCMKPYARTWNEIISQPPLTSLETPLAASLAALPARASTAASTPAALKVTAVPGAHRADRPALRRAA
ncbi:MAG TPA: hypothetical protein VNE83_06285 [Terriglobales bacterium]|nr:hypothetical protein [Terriglobales bacterium]